MNYRKVYNQIIERARKENRKKGEGTYYELHHVIPKCTGGTNKKGNLVLLTAREHFICHFLLHLQHPTNEKLGNAFVIMNMGIQRRGYNPSATTYAYLRELNSRLKKGKTPWNKGKVGVQADSSYKQGIETKKRNGNDRHSNDTKIKMSKSQTGKLKAREHRFKIGLSNRKPKVKVECPHCGLIGAGGIYRFHFDNCKKKSQI